MVTTRRQSGALALAQAPKSLAEDVSDDGESSSNSSEEEVDYKPSARKTTRRQSTAQPKAKRLKTKAVEPESEPDEESDEELAVVAKAPKRRRGKDLSLLVTMPLDIMFEILSLLSPKDLLSVTQTNKLFYKTLLSSNAKSVWIAAREPSGVPEPPADLSEARWAGLLFKSNCQSCSSTNVKIDWMLRRRACVTCKKRHLVYAKRKFATKYPDYDSEILNYILHTNIGGSAHGHASASQYYWDEDIEAVWKKWSSLKNAAYKGFVGAKDAFKTWKAERVAWVAENIELSQVNSRWYHGMQSRNWIESDVKAKEDRIQRLAGFKQRFSEAGYAAADIDAALDVGTEGIRNGVPNVTNAVWSRFKPSLEKLVIAKREARLNKELGDIVRPRLDILKALYETYLAGLRPSEKFQSPAYQFMRMVPDVAALIDADRTTAVTARDFQPVLAKLPEHISQYMREYRETLTATVPATDFKEGLDPLDMARFVFQCGAAAERVRSYGWSNRTWTEVEKCASGYLVGWHMIVSHLHSDCKGATACENGVIPASLPRHAITLNGDASVGAESLITLSGLDPMTATLSDMDAKGSLFVCTLCTYSGAKKFPVYNWRQALRHMSSSHSYHANPQFIKTLFRLATAEETEKAGTASSTLDRASIWSCDHCSLFPISGKAAVLTHLRAQHNIAQPDPSRDYFLHEELRRKIPPFEYDSRPPPMSHHKKFQCLRCTDVSAKNRRFIESGVVSHIAAKHQIKEPKAGTDYKVDDSIAVPGAASAAT